MWVLKGVSIGLVLFFFGSLVYVGNKMRQFEAGKATNVSMIQAVTVYNVGYWIAFVACLVLGCVLVRLSATLRP